MGRNKTISLSPNEAPAQKRMAMECMAITDFFEKKRTRGRPQKSRSRAGRPSVTTGAVGVRVDDVQADPQVLVQPKRRRRNWYGGACVGGKG